MSDRTNTQPMITPNRNPSSGQHPAVEQHQINLRIAQAKVEETAKVRSYVRSRLEAARSARPDARRDGDSSPPVDVVELPSNPPPRIDS